MRRAPRAFTLLELLVSIGVIALLIGLIVVSMKGIRSAAGRTESVNALRNMMRGYVTYGADHRQRLLPGFMKRQTLESVRVKVALENGTVIFDPDPAAAPANDLFCSDDVCDASSYVWRLVPYLDQNWKTLMVDYASPGLEGALEQAFQLSRYGPGSANASLGELGIGLVPAYGLNSIFLGGDSFHGDAATVARNPFDPVDPDDVIAATTTTQVLNPGRVTVFAAAMQAPNSDQLPVSSEISDLRFGYAEVRAPFLTYDPGSGEWSNRQWLVNDANEIEAVNPSLFGDGGGWPVGRHGEEDIPVAHLDGSVEVVKRQSLAEDMSRWWPFATGVR